MADVFNFYVRDNRKINFEIAEPIMREDSGVTDFRFHIPKTLNGLEVSEWSWWFVFVNAKKEKYSIALELSDDPERPLEFNIATYTVDYAMSIKAGAVQFALEAINTGTGGVISNEWHTLTYETKVKETLQGNQAEYAETESDIISELLQNVRTKVNQLVGGATPTPVSAVSQMTDTSKLYLLTTDGEWYYYNGSAWVSGGVYGAGVTDSVPTQGSTHAVQSGGVYSVLADKADKADTPKAVTPAETNADFYLTDEQGNVILELADGHVRTKHFDSSDINAETDTTFTEEGKPADSKAVGDAIASIEGDIQAVEESIPDVNGFSEVGTPQENTADMYICDAQGNVIALFKDGHIKTKYFDSANINVDDVPNRYIKYSKSIVSASGTQTIEITGDWKKGDRLILHIDDGSDGFHSKYVEYYGDNVSLVERSMYVYDTTWYEVILPADKSTIKTSFNGGLWTAGTTLTFEIYKMGEIPITPKIIKVSPNGGADFTSIRDAIDSIFDASSAINPYVIELYTGTYDTLSYYTDAEIGASGFVGLLIRDGISLKGIGTTPGDVILTASLDPDDWDSTIRGQVSTLNRQGSNTIENITVVGENIRYCVHDDFFSGGADRHHVKVKDCVFVDNGLITNRTYGMGTVSGQYIEFINCDFGNRDMVYHTNHAGRYPCMAKFDSCRGHKLYLSDYGLTASSKLNKVILNNTDFDMIDILENYNEFGLTIEGSGSADAMVNAPAGHVYKLGNIAKVKTSQSITAGKAVRANGDYIALAASPEQFYGVCIGVDSKSAYIAKSGYVCSTLVGLSGLSAGDYLTVDANSTLTATGATSANAVGVVKKVADSVAYIKLIA